MNNNQQEQLEFYRFIHDWSWTTIKSNKFVADNEEWAAVLVYEKLGWVTTTSIEKDSYRGHYNMTELGKDIIKTLDAFHEL